MPLTAISSDRIATPRDVLCIYGDPAAGKTRFATSLPERWGKIAYIALDDGSENLDSVLPAYRERISVFRPEWKNAIVDMGEIAVTKWAAQGHKTIILDTLTNAAWKLLNHVTKNGTFKRQANPITIGSPGSPEHLVLPDPADYGGVQSILTNFLTMLIDHQQDMHIIVVCHARDNSKTLPGGVMQPATFGGPDLIGRGLLTWLPRKFKTIIRLDKQVVPGMTGGLPTLDTQRIAWMSPQGIWVARRNEASPTGNPLPKLALGIDPINFWRKYDEVVG